MVTFAVSVGNLTRLCLDLGMTAWISWLVGDAVDLSVVGLLAGMRFLSLLDNPLYFCSVVSALLRFSGNANE